MKASLSQKFQRSDFGCYIQECVACNLNIFLNCLCVCPSQSVLQKLCGEVTRKLKCKILLNFIFNCKLIKNGVYQLFIRIVQEVNISFLFSRTFQIGSSLFLLNGIAQNFICTIFKLNGNIGTFRVNLPHKNKPRIFYFLLHT